MMKRNVMKKNLKENLKNLYTKFPVLGAVVQSVSVSIHGGDLAGSDLVTGTKALISDISTILAGMSISVGIVFVIYCLIRKAMADEADGKQWQKRALTAGICGILGTIAAGIVSIIAGYFGA